MVKSKAAAKVVLALSALVVVFIITTGVFAMQATQAPKTLEKTLTQTETRAETRTVTTTLAPGAAATVTQTQRVTVPTTVATTVTVPTTVTATRTIGGEIKPLKIGASCSLTGVFAAPSAEICTFGYVIWKDLLNARGGLLGRPIELIVIDDASDTKKVEANYRRLTDVDKVDFLLAPVASGNNAVALPIFEQAKNPAIHCSASTRLFTQGFKYGFSDLPKGLEWGGPWIDLMLKTDPSIKTIAILAQASEFPLDMATSVRDHAKSKGLNVVLYEQYDSALASFVPLLQKVKGLNPDLFLVGGADGHYILVTRQMKEVDFNPKGYFFVFGPYNKRTVDQLKKDAEYSFSGTSWMPWPVLPGDDTRIFTQEYIKRRNIVPNYATACGYLYGKFLEDAIVRAQSFDKEKVRDAMEQLGVEGYSAISYPIKWNLKAPNPLQNQAETFIIQIQKGEAQVLYPPQFKTANPIYPMPKWSDRIKMGTAEG